MGSETGMVLLLLLFYQETEELVRHVKLCYSDLSCSGSYNSYN